MGKGSGRGSGWVRLFVGNRGSGRVGSGQRFAGSGRVGSKKSDPWTTLMCLWGYWVSYNPRDSKSTTCDAQLAIYSALC